MFVRIHNKNSLFFCHNSNIYNASIVEGVRKRSSSFLKNVIKQSSSNCFQLCCSEPCSSCGTEWHGRVNLVCKVLSCFILAERTISDFNLGQEKIFWLSFRHKGKFQTFIYVGRKKNFRFSFRQKGKFQAFIQTERKISGFHLSRK